MFENCVLCTIEALWMITDLFRETKHHIVVSIKQGKRGDGYTTGQRIELARYGGISY